MGFDIEDEVNINLHSSQTIPDVSAKKLHPSAVEVPTIFWRVSWLSSRRRSLLWSLPTLARISSFWRWRSPLLSSLKTSSSTMAQTFTRSLHLNKIEIIIHDKGFHKAVLNEHLEWRHPRTALHLLTATNVCWAPVHYACPALHAFFTTHMFL